MTAMAQSNLNVDEFLNWAMGQEGRFELREGLPFALSPERLSHAVTKVKAFNALEHVIGLTGAPCHAVPDGMTVKINSRSAFGPDALVYCGSGLPDDAIFVPDPLIVVEVLSPSTASFDHIAKLRGYFSLPSVAHYLILDADARTLVHHRRGQGATIETQVLAEGVLRLDPPGLDIPVEEMFARPST